MIEAAVVALIIVGAFYFGYKVGLKVSSDKEVVKSTTGLDEFSKYLDGETERIDN